MLCKSGCRIAIPLPFISLILLTILSAVYGQSEVLKTEDEIDARLKIIKANTNIGTLTRNNPAFGVPILTPETIGVEGLVSNALIEKAVQLKAEKRWDDFSIGTPIPCSDDGGKLLAYHVPVHIGSVDFPTTLTPLPASEITKANLFNPHLWGTSEYWTFVVSAREADYPIPLHYPGLPPYLVTYHKATEVAQSQLIDSKVSLTKYYCLGHQGDFFEYSTYSGDTVLINAHTLEVAERKKILIRSGEERNLPKELSGKDRQLIQIYNDQVKEEWSRIKEKGSISE